MTAQKLLLFRKWDISEIEIQDVGLKNCYISKGNNIANEFWTFSIKAIQ